MINNLLFFKMYFNHEELFKKLIISLCRMFKTIKILTIFKEGIPSLSMIEYGKENYKKDVIKYYNKALKELCRLSSISKSLYGESFVMTYIDSGNKKKCLQLLEEIKDIFYYDAGIDILTYNLAN